MSFQHNQKLWIATKNDLKNTILRDKVTHSMKSTTDRQVAHRSLGDLYARYIIICNNLSELYDQTLQTQKRDMIENILVTSMNRLQELKLQMQKINMSEFVCIDDVLIELKMTPHNIEVLCPFLFPRQRDVIAQRVVDEIPKSPTPSEVMLRQQQLTGLDKYRKVLTPDEIAAENMKKAKETAADLIVQQEKARQARILFLNLQKNPNKFLPKPKPFAEVAYEFYHKPDQVPLVQIKRTKFKFNLGQVKSFDKNFKFYEPPKFVENEYGQKVRMRAKSVVFSDEVVYNGREIDEEELERVREGERIQSQLQREFVRQQIIIEQELQAVLTIQKAYRHYRLKKLLKTRHQKKLEICGLRYKHESKEIQTEVSIAEQNRLRRREQKLKFDAKIVEILNNEKARILKKRGLFIMEDITDHVRAWFREFYDGAKNFHRYPEEFEGGTILVLTGESMTVEEFLIDKSKSPEQKKKERAEKKKLKKREAKEKKKQLEIEKKAEQQRLALERKQGPTWNFKEQKLYDRKHFVELEKLQKEKHNQWQFIDETRHEAPIYDWITLDACADVHSQQRLVIDDLMRVELELLRMALARDQRTKYTPPKHKKPKKERKKKKRESVDLVTERGLENCYQELKSLNIIRKYPRRSLNDFIGDHNFAATEMRALNKPTVAHYGDIKNLVRNLILGIGPIAELPKVKSLCIAGPPKCGKKFLVDALCTEMNAVVFDLSAHVVRHIDDLSATLSLVMQVAKTVRPSVILIDAAHKPFIKKVPPEEVDEQPRKLAKFLHAKIANKIAADDGVMLIGTTNQPWNCNYVLLRKCYQKFVSFPAELDYGTALMSWQVGLRNSRVHEFDASALATVTRSYTTGDILEFISLHVDLRRRMRLKIAPLTSEELLEDLMRGPNQKPWPDKKVIKAFQAFANRTDSFYYGRRVEMARVQVIIDKEKELARRKKEAAAKKKQKK